MNELTQEELKKFFTYEPATGVFRWRIARPYTATLGAVAGCISKRGYVLITIRGRQYRAHRLAWLYVHGKWPTAFIDHKNRDPSDNRLINLREATPSQNVFNQKAHSGKAVELKGVFIVGDRKSGKMFASAIQANGKRHHLGSFPSAKEAHDAYVAAAKRLHGEYARTEI